MEKLINFCKLYFVEILFAVAVLLCIGVTTYSICCLPKMVAMVITFFAVIVLAILGYYIQKLERVSLPSKVFMITWYAGFTLLMISLIVTICTVYSLTGMRLLLYILLIILGIAIVAMFGNLIIVFDALSPKDRYPTVAPEDTRDY